VYEVKYFVAENERMNERRDVEEGKITVGNWERRGNKMGIAIGD